MQPSVATEGDRPRGAPVAFLHPLAAAIVALSACLVGFRGQSSIYRPNEDHYLRLFPFDNRFDARLGVGITFAMALLVTVFARGKVGRRLRRALGLIGCAAFALGAYYVVYSIRRDCSRWEGCDFWKVPLFLVDAVLLLLSSLSLLVLAAREPGPRLRWFGAGAVVALAIASAAWTYRATPVLRRYTGPELAGVRLQGFFESNQDFVPDLPKSGAAEEPVDDEGRIPPAIPALPMRGATMICGGDWRVVKFPDRDRCLPRRPMLSLQPNDVEQIEVGVYRVGSAPEIGLTFTREAGRQFTDALRKTGSFHFVLLNARSELIVDIADPWPIPGPTFIITSSPRDAAETDRLRRLILDRR